MRRDPKQIKRLSLLAQEVSATQIINAEPKVMQELTFPDLAAETDMWKSEDATDRVDSIGRII